MSLFNYEAYNKDGAIIHGDFEASSKEEVVEYLGKRSLSPISIKKAGEGGKKKGLLATSLFESVTSVDIVFLVRNLATTIKSGLSMIESLDILIADTEKKIMKDILIKAQSNLKNGLPLSKSFEGDKKYFPRVFIGMLRAGEFSGQLDKTFDELGRYLTREYNLGKKVKSALTYPVILLVASLLVVALLLIFVLPRLTKIFQTAGAEVPAITKFFVIVSGFLSQNLIFDVVFFGGLIWFFTGFRKTELGKDVFYKIFSKVPVSRELIKRVILVRFARTFGNLIASGISAVEALELSADSVGNKTYRKIILESAEEIKNGVSVSKTFIKYPNLFPSILTSLMGVGEKTGTLGKILVNFADFYEEDVDNKLKDLTALLEPLLLLFMGLFVGAIAFSILLPIYQLVGKFT